MDNQSSRRACATVSRVLIAVILGAVSPSTSAGQEPVSSAATPQPTATATSAAAAVTRLPVRRVLLYKNGIGYFEHVGRIHGDETVSIDLTSGQLDDVLKSLTTVDMGTGQVTGITFNSMAPIGQRLRTIGIPLAASTSRAQLLEALRGARVDVQGGGTNVTGRILSLAERQRVRGDAVVTADELTVVTDAGGVRSFDLDSGTSVRIVDEDLRRELGQYLDLIGSVRAQDVRRLAVATRGTGARDLFLSYVSEVPVWKTTYRLVVPLDGSQQPFLQGWAVVDNTLGEDWTDVELSLVAGAPQSFIQQVSQPLYAQRPVVPLSSSTMLTPQTHGGTMTGAAGADTAGVDVQRSAGVGYAGRAEGGIPGGSLGGVVGGLPSAAPPPPPPAGPVAMNRLRAMQAAASGAELGELFEYRLKQPVTIRRNQSALVPIVQADVSLERVSLWRAGHRSARPLRAVWLTNDTGLTLDGGSLTLVEGGAFAGEGLVEPIKPGERRLISYAVDLAAQVTASREGGPTRVSRVRIAGGVMTQTVEDRPTTVYTIRNDDAEARQIIIEHPIDFGFQLRGDTKPEESSPTAHRFRVRVEPRATATLRVDEVLALDSRTSITNLTDDHLALVLRGKNLDGAVEAQLRRVVEQSREVARMLAGITDRRTEVTRISTDQERVRENLKALQGSAAERQLIERYARQLTAQEDRLEVLGREIETLETTRAAEQAELTRRVEALIVDAELPEQGGP